MVFPSFSIGIVTLIPLKICNFAIVRKWTNKEIKNNAISISNNV